MTKFIDWATLASAVLTELRAPESTRICEFAAVESDLLDALVAHGYLTASQRELAEVEQGCLEHGVVHVVSPVADIDADGGQWLEIDPVSGTVERV